MGALTLRGTTAALLLAAAGGAQAQDAFVFNAFNQATLARHAPLPSAESAATPGSRVVIDWTSEAQLEQAGTELLRLDGEIVRIGLQHRWQWGGTLVSVELPLLVTGGGFLDNGVESWHDWFGLPNGARNQLPRDDYRYQYQRGDTLVFDVGGSDAALGDVRLGLARCADGGGCWRAMLQLPTGDGDRFLGGGTGLAGWYERPYRFGATARWSGVAAAGVSGVSGDGPLEDQQRSVVPFGWASLGYALTRSWEVGAQLYAHGPLHEDSDLGAFNRTGLQTTFGFQYRSAGGSRWSLAMQEDLLTRSSPDFVIHLAVDWGAGKSGCARALGRCGAAR